MQVEEKPSPPHQPTTSYAARIDSILASYKHLLQQAYAAEGADCEALWEEHLLEKHLAKP
jgi:hypothetical protein